MLQVYNTKTRKKEEFKPLKQDVVKVYYCGPTVYNYAHIGNLRAYIFEDVVVKSLRFLGYPVQSVMNITDVDDKTIRDSMTAGIPLKEFTEKYTEIFLNDIKKIGITPADEIVPVTTLIPEMVRMIQTMLNRWNAYLAEDGSIYFRVSSFKKYGKLAHLDISGMKESVRIDNDEYDKDQACDFVLWKAYKTDDGDNFWEEEFSIISEQSKEKEVITIKWRPGWHIECSACNMKYFWAQIDIHMGGEDLIFPHHQNEIAQTEACTKKEFCNYWLHNGHIMVDGKKMSKSLGNFYTLGDIEKKFSDIRPDILYRSIRLSFINGKHRDQVDFSFDKLEQGFNTIKKIDETTKRLQRYIDAGEFKYEWMRKDFSILLQEYIQTYIEKIEDDFNIPEALSIFFGFQTTIHSELDTGDISLDEANAIMDLLKTFHQVLGILNFDILSETSDIPEEILQKLTDRNTAKQEKDFTTADSIRDELTEAWYKIIDERTGSRIERI